MSKKVTIDFSSFRDKEGNEIIKELTIVDIDTKCEQHWIFKSPQNVFNSWAGPSKQNLWLSRHFHGIDFQHGFSEYESLESSLETLCNEMQLIFAADAEKAMVLEKLFKYKRVVFNLGALGCPIMQWTPSPPSQKSGDHMGEDCVDGIQVVQETQELQTVVSDQCLYHSLHAPGFFCTRSRAHYLAEWCAKNPHLIDMNDSSVREKTFTGCWKIKSPNTKEIAENGFVKFTSFKDDTKCVYCNLALHQWEEGDSVEDDHYYNSPFCKLQRYQMQLRCESEQMEKDKKRPGYLKNRNKDSDDCEERDAFYLRYGQVSPLTWNDVKALCSA